ncbi:MAG: response regulator [Frankia sp.]|nr:response regulator [Frankia sp.]
MTDPTKVLVVEDDPSVRGLLETMLSTEGYAVTTAPDGLAGLVKLSSDPPRVVLLDLMMPDLGGLRVIDEMQADPDLRDVPVIVVTGQAGAVDALRARLGNDNVFLKPFDVAELLARVSAVAGPGDGG